MKKLKLSALDFGAKEILTRTQLKNVFGGVDGSGAASCSVTCSNKEVKTVNCGYNVICQTSGTKIKCGDGEYKEQCQG
ncbi:hypothetical protein [Chitinophaga sp. OAE865]|uniref:hypothetical protein n=1 Tax=Chitinophaga sp. OAE865 TaxID=2817898 RepID=UPI001AE6965F